MRRIAGGVRDDGCDDVVYEKEDVDGRRMKVDGAEEGFAALCHGSGPAVFGK